MGGDTPGADSPPVNRALALRFATRLYGTAPWLQWIKSDEVDVFPATLDGAPGDPSKVIRYSKITRRAGDCSGRRRTGADGPRRRQDEHVIYAGSS